MKRPLMGLGIALVVGIAAALFEISVWIIGIISVAVILYSIFLKDSSWKYGVGLSFFFVVGFCRTVFIQQPEVLLENELQARVYKTQEKEKTFFVFLKETSGERILAVIMKEDMKQTFYKGQILRVSGESEYFSTPGNPGQFDEKTYYKSQGVDYRMWVDKVHILSEGNSFYQYLRWLEILRQKISEFYEKYMERDGAAVFQAAVLGERVLFQGDLQRYYQENGWLHLVTISGLHLSFIALGFYRWIRKMSLPLIPSMATAVLLMGAYGYMTDLGDSMLRAMGMMSFLLAGELLGRQRDVMTSLVLTADVMVMLRPERILSAGFLLSFGAVAGVELGRWFCKMMDTKKRILWMQTGIFLTTLPMIVWYMFEIPLLGFFYNFFMIPLVSCIVPIGFMAGLIGIWGLPVLSQGAGLVLAGGDRILQLVHQLPSAVWVCGRPELWQLILYILLLGTSMVMIAKGGKKAWKCCLTGACLLMLCFRIREDRIVCMDTGQGDGICLMTKGGSAVFIDGGSSDVSKLYEYRIEPLLKYYGIRDIDLWLLTHGDKDHVSGIKEVLDSGRGKIRQIGMPDIYEDDVLNEIKTRGEQQGIPVERIYRNNKVILGNFQLTCIFPEKEWCGSDKNNNSLVLSLERGKGQEPFRMLLMGDLESPGEKILLDMGINLQCDILKAGHHGSSGSSSGVFLEAAKPAWAVISCGLNNSYGHPHRETLERLEDIDCEWLTTAKMGAVIVEFSKKSYQVSAYKMKD